MIAEGVRSLGVITLSSIALALGKMDVSLVKELAQVLLMLATLGLTALQGYSIAMRIRREKRLYELVDHARESCQKAKDGHCPVEAIVDKIKQSKT